MKKVLVRKTTKKIKHVISSKKLTATKKKKTTPVKASSAKATASRSKKVLKKTTKIVKKSKVLLKKKGVIKKRDTGFKLVKSPKNPILEPRAYSWESQASFNPAAISLGGKIHLFYRALGEDGVSRIGYASSYDGVNFNERLSYPVYSLKDTEVTKDHHSFTSPVIPSYNRNLYASGGGWGGCEDPRLTKIDDTLYMTYTAWNGEKPPAVALTSIKEKDFLFHLAWQTDLKKSNTEPQKDISQDLIGLVNILETCKAVSKAS